MRRLYEHLRSSINRAALDENGLVRAGATIIAHPDSASSTTKLAVVVRCSAPIAVSTLGLASFNPSDEHRGNALPIRVFRAAPLSDIAVYGFVDRAAYVRWIAAGLWGNPPKTAGDGHSVTPEVEDNEPARVIAAGQAPGKLVSRWPWHWPMLLLRR